MAAGIVGQDGVGHAMAAQFEGGERRALVARPCLVHPHMQGDACVMRQVDRRQGGAVIHRRQPAGIAMGEDIDGLIPVFPALLLLRDFADQREPVPADRLAHRHVLVGDQGGFLPGDGGALVARLVEQRPAHPPQRPFEIDGGGPGFGQHLHRLLDMFVGGILAHRQRQPIGAHRPDQRRAARLHGDDGVRGGFGVAQGQGDEFMRQPGLVDDAEPVLADGPDGAVMFAADLHVTKPSCHVTAPPAPSPSWTDIRRIWHTRMTDWDATISSQDRACGIRHSRWRRPR